MPDPQASILDRGAKGLDPVPFVAYQVAALEFKLVTVKGFFERRASHLYPCIDGLILPWLYHPDVGMRTGRRDDSSVVTVRLSRATEDYQ